jgi:hypothetical protein
MNYDEKAREPADTGKELKSELRARFLLGGVEGLAKDDEQAINWIASHLARWERTAATEAARKELERLAEALGVGAKVGAETEYDRGVCDGYAQCAVILAGQARALLSEGE